MHFPRRDDDLLPPVITAGDLRAGRSCEFGLLVTADVLLGRREHVETTPDPIRERFGDLGREREQEVTDRLTREVGEGVVDARRLDHEATLALLGDPSVRLVHQAPVRANRFTGRADHLIRDGDGQWIVAETKLASSAHAHALFQVAAYATALAHSGVALAPFVRLFLGDDSVVDMPLSELTDDLHELRERVLWALDAHAAEGGPVTWGDPRWTACLRCDACRVELAAHDDVGVVAGVRSSYRRLLRDAGVRTSTELAQRTEPVEGLAKEKLAAMRSQARLQLVEPTPERPLAHEVHSPAALLALPAPSAGDIFFDFEGDPMWRGGEGDARGLEYLFGCLTTDGGQERFTSFWAHDRAAERKALIAFVDWVVERRARWPDLHIYHYADYERAALSRLAARHEVCEAEVAGLVSDGVLVDLYAVVKAGVRVGSPSYSIKRLEPLYMGDDLRDADGVTAGGASIIEYQRYREAVAVGHEVDAAQRLADLQQYNEYDCLSTLRLRDWLLAQVAPLS